jgi:SAM-dependent methyltransferase
MTMTMSTDDVVAMYTRYPYPTPLVGKSLAYDVANLFYLVCPGDELDGRTILDAGCGTGQRLLGFAKRYPRARFVGIDATEASLEVARQLAVRHAIPNVSFARHDIMRLELADRFDFIVSTGVVHCLEDPRKGLENLCRHLTGDGVICVWHYHPFGEFDRLLRRELLLLLWGDERADLEKGERIMKQLRLALPAEQYGYTSSATNPDSDRGRLSQNADAFMHPIVNAYRFDEAMAMCRGCEGVEWVAVNGINTPEGMKLVDLAEVEEAGRPFSLWGEDLFDDEQLRELYRARPAADRLGVLELLTKPTGFTVLAGKGGSVRRLAKRVQGNAFSHGQIPEPYSRLFRV